MNEELNTIKQNLDTICESISKKIKAHATYHQIFQCDPGFQPYIVFYISGERVFALTFSEILKITQAYDRISKKHFNNSTSIIEDMIIERYNNEILKKDNSLLSYFKIPVKQ